MGNAARLFHGSADQTLYGRITPSDHQLSFLQEQWNALADHLRRELRQKHGYAIATWIQGSYKYGTLIKPVHKGEEYDVDLGVYFEWDSRETDLEPTPAQIRAWVQRELHDYKRVASNILEVVEPPKDRCSRAIYAKQFHIDTPTYHLDSRTDRRRLAHLSKGWEDRDPKPLYQWFRDTVTEQQDRDQMRRLIRYLKAWAAINFNDAPDARPSSVFLSVLVAEQYSALRSSFGRFWERKTDDDALHEAAHAIRRRLERNRRVQNPIDRDEDLNRIPANQWDAFLSRIEALCDASEAASTADDEAAAALAWSGAFSFLMPLPETQEVEVVGESGRAVMTLPEIRIDVYARNPKRFLTSHTNEVLGVARDCDLVFTITNAHIIPHMATIEWTVRNEGAEADILGDLGHSRAAVRLVTVDESTAYVGRHYMDCIVRVNGSVYAVRRVPVIVRDVKHLPVSAPKTPSWRRLTSARRR
jgi:hypothetical protein